MLRPDHPPRTDLPERDKGHRFVIYFRDGGRLAVRDKRRLSRAVLQPDLSALGPDAARVGRDSFRKRVERGTAPRKARIMDQW